MPVDELGSRDAVVLVDLVGVDAPTPLLGERDRVLPLPLDGPAVQTGPLVIAALAHVDRRRADHLAGRIVEAEAVGRILSWDIAELAALRTAIAELEKGSGGATVDGPGGHRAAG